MDDAVEEQELHLYVDDQLDEERRAAFEVNLRDHPELAARVADYRRQNALMRQLFAVQAEAGTSEAQGFLIRQLQRQLGKRPRRHWRRFGAVAAGLLVAAMFGAAGTELYHERSAAAEPEPMSNFAETAALLHSVYAGGGEQAEFGADGVAKLSSMLPTRLGAPLHVPDLSRKGFTLVGGRLLAAPEGPAAQLLYRDQAGRLVTVLLGASQSPQPNAPPLQQRQDLSLYTWLDGPIGVAVVGKLNRDELRGLAEAAQRTLLPPPAGARPGSNSSGVASRT